MDKYLAWEYAKNPNDFNEMGIDINRVISITYDSNHGCYVMFYWEYKTQQKARQTMLVKYKRKCPWCGEVCEGYEGNNLFCKCFAKFYWEDKVWLNRNTGEEIWESEAAK